MAPNVPLHRLVPLTLALAAPACAAPRADLFALRDAALPGRCEAAAPGPDKAPGTTPFGKIDEAALPGGGTLFLVPCSTTAFDTVEVAVLVRDGRPQLLSFPAPSFTRPGGWDSARLDRIGKTVLLLSPQFDTETGILTESARIAPGMGAGETVTRYRIAGTGAPELLGYEIHLDGRAPIVLWPER